MATEALEQNRDIGALVNNIGISIRGQYTQSGFEMYDSYGSFRPSASFGIGGGGLARRIDSLPVVERIRYDDTHGEPHLNYEVILEELLKRRPMLTKHRAIGLIIREMRKEGDKQ